MERSSSEPALCNRPIDQADYYVPRHGLGLTGHEKKVRLGTWSKDDGKVTSRIAQIVRQAGKTPGPGTHAGHTTWCDSKLQGTRRIDETVTRFGNAFSKSSRDYKQYNKVPSPNHYEAGGIDSKSIASKDNLSHNPRVKFGKSAKGPRRSFLDRAEDMGKNSPGPGLSETVPRDRLDWHKPAHAFDHPKTESRGQPHKLVPAPNHYAMEHKLTEARSIEWTTPKCESNNFIDKTIKNKTIFGRTAERSRMPCPGPGQQDQIVFEKITRGTKYLQLRGMGRSPVSGYL